MATKTREKLTKKDLQELASDIMLELSEEEIRAILKVEAQIRQKFNHVIKINTDNVEPIFYPLENEHHFLRPDETTHVLEQAQILKNAPRTSGDFVTIEKVVK